MPTTKINFETKDETVEIGVDFQIWCSVCAHGLCWDTYYIKNTDNHFETYCEKCQEKLSNLEDENAKLEKKISELKREIYEMFILGELDNYG